MKKYASLAILIGPILEPYVIGSITLANFFIIAVTFTLLLFGTERIRFPKTYTWFFLYALVIPIITAALYNYLESISSIFIPVIFFSLAFLVLPFYISYKHVIKYYKILVIITSIIFILQELMFSFLGFRFSGLIPFLDIKYANIDMTFFRTSQMFARRSSSIFLEPAHFAQFLLPYLAIKFGELHYQKKIFDKMAIFVSLILLFTWSGNAIIISSILWTVYILSFNTTTIKKVVFIIPFFAILSFLAFDYVSSTEKGVALLERRSELDLDAERISSGTIRLYRGYYVYKDLPLGAQIFGVSTGGYRKAIDDTPARNMFYDYERYLNNTQALLIGYGIIGSILFILFLQSLYRRNSYGGRMLLLTFILLSFIESFFFVPKMILMLSLAAGFKREYNKIQHK